MKKNLLIASGLLAICMTVMLVLASFRPSTAEEGGYATMMIYENFSIVNCKIIVTYPDEETEVIDLGPFKYNDDFLAKNNLTITRTLNELKKRGYEVVTMTASGKINSNKAMRITTIILEKD